MDKILATHMLSKTKLAHGSSHHATRIPEENLPTQLLNQCHGIPSDIAWEFNSINAL
jgi:hypothetical protein